MAKRATGLILGTLAMLGAAAPAYADDQVTVEQHREPASSVGVVAKDGLYGGVAGAAVGGGIMLIQNHGWDGRTMAISTGVGLLLGVGLGLVDAASQHPAAQAALTPDNARPVDRPQTALNAGLPAPAFSVGHSGQF